MMSTGKAARSVACYAHRLRATEALKGRTKRGGWGKWRSLTHKSGIKKDEGRGIIMGDE